MKKKYFYRIIAALSLILFLNGCVVISFYPLYEESDLFENDLLLGQWIDDDGAKWEFIHPEKGKKDQRYVDNKSYRMVIYNEKDSTDGSSLDVHVVKIAGNYYLDFFINEHGPTNTERDPFVLFDLHLMPVHTFARMDVVADTVKLQWFDPDWLEKQIRENKMHIRHEDNGENILLTASTGKLKAFIEKYGELEEAYDLDVKLVKHANEAPLAENR